MSAIAELRRTDVPYAAALFDRVVRGGTGDPPAGLAEHFDRTLFGSPWADAQLPSLAAFEDGRLVAFLGSHARRLRIDGRPARMAVSGPLVVDPSARHPALGALLLREYLRGPQALSVTDGGTELMRAIWERAGGQAAHLRSIEWVLPFRPLALGAAWLRHRRGRRDRRPARRMDVLTPVDRALAPAVAALGRLVGSRSRPVAGGRGLGAARRVLLEPLTPAALVDHLPRLTSGRRITPDYDLPFATWLFEELALAPGRGTPVARLVRRGSVPIGMFVYFLQAGGVSLVVQVAAADEMSARTVVDALVEDARGRGAAALHGRLETDLLQAVTAAGGFLVYGGNALIHAGDPAVGALATSPHALLTRLEGERWMGPHLL